MLACAGNYVRETALISDTQVALSVRFEALTQRCALLHGDRVAQSIRVRPGNVGCIARSHDNG
jgi:hypothetical protein